MDKGKITAQIKKNAKQSKDLNTATKIIETAKRFTTVTDTLRELSIHIHDYENLCRRVPALRQSVNESLRREITVKTQHIDGSFKEVIFRFPDKTRAAHRYSDAEKEQITDLVCEAIMNAITVKSICESIAVNMHTFYSWVNADGKHSFDYAVRRFQDTQQQLSFTSKMEEVTAAKVSLRRALSHDKIRTTTEHYDAKGLDGSKLILRGKTESVKDVAPNATLMQFVLTNHDENYRKTIGGNNEGYELMDTEEIMRLLQKEKEVDDKFKVDSDETE